MKKTVQWCVRLGFLAAAILLATGGPIPFVAAKVFPSLSPLVAACSALTRQGWYIGLFWLAGPLAVLLLAIWKGRLFCRWICPTGTLYAIPSRLSLRKKLLPLRLNGYLFWIILFASAVGVPLLLWVDPLATFNRVTPLLSGTYTLASLIPGLLIPLMLLLGFFQPMLWCTHLCPLGYSFELVHGLRTPGPKKTFDRNRRQVAAGLFIGLPVSLLVGRFLLANRNADAAPILPPGAKDRDTFAATCTRCYACVNTCPTRIIQVTTRPDRQIGQWFQPEIDYFQHEEHVNWGYCPENCFACSNVCPANALTPLTLRQKRQLKIGTAEVITEACIAWDRNLDCMACQEHCPYNAIDSDFSDEGVARPVVDTEICRGCGLCFKACPAERKGNAIRMLGVDAQTHIDDGYADLFEELENS